MTDRRAITVEDEYIELVRTELVKVAYHAKQIAKCMDKIFKLSETHYEPERETISILPDDSDLDPMD